MNPLLPIFPVIRLVAGEIVVLVEKVSRVVIRIYILEEESRDEADARGIESESPHMRPVVVSHLAVSR